MSNNYYKRKISVGDRKKRITLIKKEKVKVNGKVTEQEIEVATLWAYVCNLTTREYLQASAIQAELNIKFNIRYFRDLDNTMRIRYNNKTYEIVNIDNVDEANREMWLLGKCVENGN